MYIYLLHLKPELANNSIYECAPAQKKLKEICLCDINLRSHRVQQKWIKRPIYIYIHVHIIFLMGVAYNSHNCKSL